MRGFPPIQILVFGIAFALLAIPLIHLTGSSIFPVEAHAHDDHDDEGHDHEGPQVVQGGTEHPEGEHVHAAVPALVRLRYAHRPLSVSLKQDGKEMLTGADFAESPIEVKAEIGVSHDGNEMILEAKWPAGTPNTALTLEIEPDGFESLSETRWTAETELNEVVTFQW